MRLQECGPQMQQLSDVTSKLRKSDPSVPAALHIRMIRGAQQAKRLHLLLFGKQSQTMQQREAVTETRVGSGIPARREKRERDVEHVGQCAFVGDEPQEKFNPFFEGGELIDVMRGIILASGNSGDDPSRGTFFELNGKMLERQERCAEFALEPPRARRPRQKTAPLARKEHTQSIGLADVVGLEDNRIEGLGVGHGRDRSTRFFNSGRDCPPERTTGFDWWLELPTGTYHGF